LQLAYGGFDPVLYGHSAGTGEFFTMGLDGTATSIGSVGGPQFTDLASGLPCEVRYESAWGDGDDFSGSNWATYFTYTIQGWRLLETVQVRGYLEPGEIVPVVDSTTALNAGELYQLRASGTYRFANWGAFGIADAHCNYRSSLYGGPGWMHSTLNYLEVWVNGAVFDWGPDNCPTLTADPIGHSYNGFITGTGSTISFQIMDSCSGSIPGCYQDNSEFITVEIWGWS
jgi:hypothetical protein